MSFDNIDQLLGGIAQAHPVIGTALLHHETIRGTEISFADRPYLVELYDYLPRCTSVAISKAPQVGVTEMLMQMVFQEAGWQGRIVGYVLPTQDHRNRFVDTRIDKALSEVPAYRSRMTRADQTANTQGTSLPKANTRSGDSKKGNLKVKSLGSGIMLFLSAKTDGDFVEFSADTMIIDEYDLCLQQSTENVGKARDRLRESESPRLIKLGNPEMPGQGIDKMVDEGDCRLWHFRCTHPDCREWQPIDWLESMVKRNASGAWELRDEIANDDESLDPRPVCRKCRRPFTRGFEGVWIPLYPGPGRERSYRMARWDMLKQPLREAWKEWVEAQASTEAMRLWWRGWAGRGWEPVIGSVTAEIIRLAAILDPMDHEGGESFEGRAVTSGVDVGNDLHVVISELVRGNHGRVERRALWCGAVSDPEQVIDLWVRYHARTIVVDAGPERRMSRALAKAMEAYSASVWPCDFDTSDARATGEDWSMNIDWRKGRVTVNKTQLLDAALDCMRAGAKVGRQFEKGEPIEDPKIDGVRLWPLDVECVFGFTNQMTAPRRMFSGNRIVWENGGKPDHFRLADAYDLLAMVLDGRGGQIF